MQFWPALAVPAFDTHCQTADTFVLFFPEPKRMPSERAI
jgi:hypothetical protein